MTVFVLGTLMSSRRLVKAVSRRLLTSSIKTENKEDAFNVCQL